MWSSQMMIAGAMILSTISCIFATPELSNPGKVFFWTYGEQRQEVPNYITKSMDIPEAMSALQAIANNYELIVILHPNQQTDVSFLSKEIQQHGENVQVFNYVYPTSEHHNIAKSLQSFFERSQQVTPETLATTVQQKSLLANEIPDFVQLVNHDHEMANVYQNAITNLITQDQLKLKVLFVSYEDVQLSTIPVPSAGRRLLGEYSRILTTTTYTSALTQGIYYLPEGTEYSIYYADTYLYITPDIFTGILTGLFLFFTVLIGLTCLGSIQGMSSFYDKIPIVGREA